MAGLFRVLVFIPALFMLSSATLSPRNINDIEDALVRTIAFDKSVVAQSLLQTSATLRQWGAQHIAQLEMPVITAETAAASFLQVATAPEVAGAESLSHTNTKRSLRKVRSRIHSGSLGVDAPQAAIEVSSVYEQPEASAPSLLQTSEAEEDGGGSQEGIALGTQHKIVHGLALQLSDSPESQLPLHLAALLGIIAGLAALMLQLSSSGHPSVALKLGDRKSLGRQSMQESSACATDRGS